MTEGTSERTAKSLGGSARQMVCVFSLLASISACTQGGDYSPRQSRSEPPKPKYDNEPATPEAEVYAVCCREEQEVSGVAETRRAEQARDVASELGAVRSAASILEGRTTIYHSSPSTDLWNVDGQSISPWKVMSSRHRSSIYALNGDFVSPFTYTDREAFSISERSETLGWSWSSVPRDRLILGRHYLASPPPRPLTLGWHSKVQDANCVDCQETTVVQRSRPYQLKVSLKERSEQARGTTTPAISIAISDLPPGEPHYFKLIPIYVDGVAPLTSEITPILLSARRPADGSEMWAEASIDFRVLPEARKCAQLVVSVWDFDLRVAHDAFMVTLPVPDDSTAESACPDLLNPNQNLTGPTLISVTDAFKPRAPADSVPQGNRISLYAFQLPLATGDSYAFAVLAPLDGESKVRGWRLKNSLLTAFGRDAGTLSGQAEIDRGKMRVAAPGSWIYEKTARYIRNNLFEGKSVGGKGKAQAKDAFEEIRDFINAHRGTTVVTQFYVPMDGEEPGLMFLPLRTMTANGSKFFTEDFQLLAPLPGAEEIDETECIADWRVILDGDLDTTEEFKGLRALAPKPWRPQALSVYEDIEGYLDPGSVSDEALQAAQDRSDDDGGTGLIILAHYGGGKLGLDRDLELPVNRLNRPFPYGSAAVLAACETATPTEANGIVRQLRGNQVDTFLTSPLKVPVPYAVSLVTQLVAKIDHSYAKGETPTLRDLYSGAMEAVGNEPNANLESKNQGREYVLAGNAERRLCKLQFNQDEQP